MKTIIIEDEAIAADALENMLLKVIPQAEVIAKLESIEESVEWFQKNEFPDLVFCDIHLSDGSSFEIFKQVEMKAPVVFTTAYNQYAIEAFKVNSVDYLLKPIKKEDLEQAIKKYDSLQQNHFSLELQNIQSLINKSLSSKKSRFMVKSGQVIKTIPSDEVAYFLAEEGVVLLINNTGNRFVINYTLDQLEHQLDEKVFFRANRQIIVNIHAVKEVNPYFKGRLHLTVEPRLKDDQIISSVKASAFKDWLDL